MKLPPWPSLYGQYANMKISWIWPWCKTSYRDNTRKEKKNKTSKYIIIICILFWKIVKRSFHSWLTFYWNLSRWIVGWWKFYREQPPFFTSIFMYCYPEHMQVVGILIWHIFLMSAHVKSVRWTVESDSTSLCIKYMGECRGLGSNSE